MSARHLPRFDRPPVVETAIGVEFAQLDKWTVPHYGLYWSRIRDAYPVSRSQWVPTVELPPPPGVAPFQVRSQFLTASGDRLVQLQYDRLFSNWQKLGDADEYPHYQRLLPIFEQAWAELGTLLVEEHMDPPVMKTCEVTYVNHIPKGEGWDSLAELAQAMDGWHLSDSTAPEDELESVSLHTIHTYGRGAGRLQTSLQHAIRNRDLREIVQLTLTARTTLESASQASLIDALGLAHERVIAHFAKFTEGPLQQIWLRRN